MCLITNQKEVITLTEDLIVYKLFEFHEGNLYSPYQGFKYEKNKLYKTKFSYDNGINVPYFDTETSIFLSAKYDPNWYDRSLDDMGLIGINKGFHAALTVERLKNNVEYIFKCKIPSGAEVYYDGNDLVVSNQIIVLCLI